MKTRKERRAELAPLKRKVQNRRVREILTNELKTGKGTEVYRLDDDGTGRPLYLNVTAMKEWVKAHSEVRLAPIDFERAKRLIDSGAIEKDHIFDHTIRHDPEPIITCAKMAGGDQIVDGAHRYVAFCMGAAQFGMFPPIPTYVLQPEEWRRFVIPPHVAKLCGFK